MTGLRTLTVERAREFLARAKTTDEVKDIRDKARAVELYLRSRKASLESQNDAAEIRLRAERRLGQLVPKAAKNKGAEGNKLPNKQRGRKTGPRENPAEIPTYAEQGIEKRDVNRWKALANIPDRKFEEHVQDTRRGEGAAFLSPPPIRVPVRWFLRYFDGVYF